MKRFGTVLSICWGLAACALAQETLFVGALGGISTLSGDAQSLAGPDSAAVSLYRPSNGPVVNLFAGWHLHDYVSVQGNYLLNSNDIALVSSLSSAAGSSFFEQKRESTQQAVIADVLLYFRDRRNWVRPYLSVGTGLAHLRSKERRLLLSTGAPVLPPTDFTSVDPVLRVAVGIDLAIRKGWNFRYSFSESLGNNPISEQLTPPGMASLKNFKNLFGFAKRF